MKFKRIILSFSFIMFVFVGVKAQANNNSDIKQTEMQIDSVYTCHMHPEIRSSVPGTCPKCGMEFVKKYIYQDGQQKMPMKCGMMNNMDGMNKNKDINTETSPKKDSVVYFCPMCSEVISNTPGNCPECGMKLEKKIVTDKKNKKKHKMKCGMR